MSLKVSGLRFRYSKKRNYVIDGVDFELKEGSLTVLMGPSGCGKSTLLGLITGFYEPGSGSIILCDKELNGHRPVRTEKRDIGMVFQDYVSFPHMTVAQNILFGISGLPRNIRLLRLHTIFNLIEMREFAKYFPHMLSGGQRQRVALGRSLAPSPKLLLLDEPFSNLDTSLRNKIRWEVRSMIKKFQITTLLVTHDASDLDISESVLLFEKGKVIPQT